MLEIHLKSRRRLPASFSVLLLAAAIPFAARAQSVPPAVSLSGNQSSAQNPYFGSIVTAPAKPEAIRLSLDDAIRMGLEHNLALITNQQSQRSVTGQKLIALNDLLPNLSASASTGVHQISLVAQGIKPSVFAGEHLPPAELALIPSIVKVDVTTAQANLTQTLFDLPAYERYRASQDSEHAAAFTTSSSRGQVVETVATTYLQTLAAAATVDNDAALLRTSQEVLRQADAEYEAGTAARLDALRARVQFQQQQQTLIADQNTYTKDLIALNREIGLAADQKIQLTDLTPYSELASTTLEDCLKTAYANRQDWQSLQWQLRSSERKTRAAKYERLPTINFGGNYGVTGVTHGFYHGTFNAAGTISVPLFKEAGLRGDRQVAEAASSNTQSQLADLRTKINAQLRDSLLDIESTAKLVQVARSNQELAAQTLSDTIDRAKAGVDDNLPVVQAQATLAAAQNQLVNSLYQFNLAKLGLARHLGILEQSYRDYIGK